MEIASAGSNSLPVVGITFGVVKDRNGADYHSIGIQLSDGGAALLCRDGIFGLRILFFLRRFLLLSAGSTWRMIKRVGSIVICAVCVPLIWAVMERPLEANGLFDNVGQGNG